MPVQVCQTRMAAQVLRGTTPDLFGRHQRHARHRLLHDRQLISAESTPNRIASHQTDVVGAGAVEHDAAEPDAEEAADLVAEEREARSVASQRVPNMTAMMPLVGGTVESHIRPIDRAEGDAGDRRDREQDEGQDRRARGTK